MLFYNPNYRKFICKTIIFVLLQSKLLIFHLEIYGFCSYIIETYLKFYKISSKLTPSQQKLIKPKNNPESNLENFATSKTKRRRIPIHFRLAPETGLGNWIIEVLTPGNTLWMISVATAKRKRETASVQEFGSARLLISVFQMSDSHRFFSVVWLGWALV